ncbi:histidine phosphatase family protein [Aegicerativicinus sediminis]
MKGIKELKTFYKNQSDQDCLKICTTTATTQIILIRHARPIISPESFVTFEDAERHLTEYRNSSVYADFRSPICTEELTDVPIYHSDLQRSKETAMKLFPPELFKLEEDARFRELDRQNLKLPFKTPYKIHTTLSRIAWLTGKMKHIELPKEAWKRLKGNANYLDSLGQKEKVLIIVAHGFHNFFVGRFLKRLGYRLVNNGGHKHLSVNIWAR